MVEWLLLGLVVLAAIAMAFGRQHYRRQLAELRAQLDAERVVAAEAQALRVQAAVTEAQLQARDVSLQALQQQSQQANQQLLERAHEVASLQTRLDHQQQLAEKERAALQEVRSQMGRDFELLANRIFDEKTARFTTNSKQLLDGSLNPLREQLADFRKRVDEVYDKDTEGRSRLFTTLDQLQKLNSEMSQEARNLTQALKGDSKAQGNWGEVILERVLEDSGLHKGREYETQLHLKHKDERDDGRIHLKPDVVVHLPEGKDIIIDSKVSLLHYEQYCSAADAEAREQALKLHVDSVRRHIKGLSFKDYENLDGVRTLDFIFIFIPIESAFMLAFEHDQAMFRDAYEKNIVVVGPTTLLATLRTVQSIWRYERQNRNAEEIARQAGALHDKFVGFLDDMDNIAVHLARAGKSHEDALSKLAKGRGNLVTSADKLRQLGAKTKKSLAARTEEAESSSLESLPVSDAHGEALLLADDADSE